MTTAQDSTVKKRKVAQQDRSKAKVRLILETTLLMLNEGPADRITTNEIARRAGISIGSLYQFFPKKEAIFYELFSHWLANTLALLDEVGERFDGTEPVEEFADAIFACLSPADGLNSPGHWQLLRAMGSTAELAALEAKHQQEVFKRIIAFQQKFGTNIPPARVEALAVLQHHVTVGCLAAASQLRDHAERDAAMEWAKHTIRLIYDYDKLSAGD